MTLPIVITVGTRPEVIKMAPIHRELKSSSSLRPILLSTGQHREMLAQAFGAFSIKADHDLQLMKPGQSLPLLTSRVVESVSEFLGQHQPSAVLVQGDTTTVLATALAAAFARIPIGHVEAGLRTYDMNHPFPEELNRRLVSPLARWHFVPTESSKQNLVEERIDPATIHVTGNSVIDALLWTRDRVSKRTESAADVARRLGIPEKFASEFMHDSSDLPSSNAAGKKQWILVTGHRRESFGGGFESICEALLGITKRYPEAGIVYPVHLNPNVREPVLRLLSNSQQICLIEPVAYEDFIWLMDRCYFLLSDSGGVQEEAPSLGKPVLVMREKTERPEGIEAGTCRLVGTNKDRIIAEATTLLDSKEEYARRSALKNPYGDGQTSARIREILEADLSG